ncbi:hypothetical protein Ancab_016990 [Ancistrocladus abbreviatus]
MGPNMRSQHPGLPQPNHSQPPFHSHVKAPGSLGSSFPHGQPPLPSQLPPQPLYQCTENKELQERIKALEQQLSSGTIVKESSSPQQDALDEYTEELKKKVQYQEIENEKLKLEHASKQREAALEAALAEKEFAEEECRKKVDEAKKREASLENDLENMWVLVAKLKKEGGSYS